MFWNFPVEFTVRRLSLSKKFSVDNTLSTIKANKHQLAKLVYVLESLMISTRMISVLFQGHIHKFRIHHLLRCLKRNWSQLHNGLSVRCTCELDFVFGLSSKNLQQTWKQIDTSPDTTSQFNDKFLMTNLKQHRDHVMVCRQ